MAPRTARHVLGAGRLAVGLSALVAPRTAARAFGIDPARSDGFITRLFGSRDVLLGGALLAAPREYHGPVVRLGVAIDGIDTVSGIVERRCGRMSTWAFVAGAGGAALFTALGLAAAQEV